MLKILKSSERAKRGLGWVESRHSFNAGGVDAQDLNGFRALREINDDLLAPGAAFPMHPHKDLEMLCFILEGSLAHSDGFGRKATLNEGDALRISAGAGMEHAEANASDSKPVRFVQAWIRPSRPGFKPSYEQMRFGKEEKEGRLKLMASGDREEDALFLHQDVQVYGAILKLGDSLVHPLGPNRNAWIQMLSGAAIVNLKPLESGDGAAVSGENSVQIECVEPCELLLFNLG